MPRYWLSLLLGVLPVVAVAQSPAQPSATGPTKKLVAKADELFQMANALMDLKRFDAAITAYTLALEQDPDNGAALANRALAYAWTNRVKEASDDLAAAEKILPESAILHRVKAILANRRSDQATELAELTKSLGLEPDNPFALSFRASIYAERQQYEAALLDAETYIRARPDEPEAYQMKAELLAAQRKWPLAVAQAELLRSRFSRDSRALASAAEIFGDSGKREDALAVMNQAIALDEGFFYLWKVRAGIRRWDDFAGRRLDLGVALTLAPGDLGIITKLGLLEFAQHNWAAAHARFSEVLEKEPKDFGVLAYRSMTSLKMLKQQAAEKDHAAAIAASSGPGDLSRICWAYGTEGIALDWASAPCDQAVAADPAKASYRVNRGFVRLRLGQPDIALEDFDQAVLTDRNNASAYYGRALSHLRKGDRDRANREREQALSIKPTIDETFVAQGLGDFADGGAKGPAPGRP